MFTRILTELERKRLRAYLKADGEKSSVVRSLSSRARRYLPQIEEDLRLLRELLETYERSKTSPRPSKREA
jgi:hypothetical protein